MMTKTEILETTVLSTNERKVLSAMELGRGRSSVVSHLANRTGLSTGTVRRCLKRVHDATGLVDEGYGRGVWVLVEDDERQSREDDAKREELERSLVEMLLVARPELGAIHESDGRVSVNLDALVRLAQGADDGWRLESLNPTKRTTAPPRTK